MFTEPGAGHFTAVTLAPIVTAFFNKFCPRLEDNFTNWMKA
jgi:hypothetical protein